MMEEAIVSALRSRDVISTIITNVPLDSVSGDGDGVM